MAERKKRILVADDDSDVAQILNDTLLTFGYEVDIAQNGKEAVLSALENRPDAVLMDIRMPTLSGMDALKLFSFFKNLRQIHVIMLTALNSKSDVVQSLQTGATDYITKPFQTANLRERVARALNIAKSETHPGYRCLKSDVRAKDGAIIIGLNGELDAYSLEELQMLIEGIEPLQPLTVVFDFAGVTEIDTGVIAPFTAIENSIRHPGGTPNAINIREDSCSSVVLRALYNTFRIEAETSPAKKAESKAAAIPVRKIKSSKALIRPGLQYENSVSGAVSIISISGILTDKTCSRVWQALTSAGSSKSLIAVSLEKIDTADDKGMQELSKQLVNLKAKKSVEDICVVCSSSWKYAAEKALKGTSVRVYDSNSRAVDELTVAAATRRKEK